jgi:hypothetical protein
MAQRMKSFLRQASPNPALQGLDEYVISFI